LEKKVEREEMVLEELPALSMQIVGFMRENGRITMATAIKLTGASRNTLRWHFSELVQRGRLAKHGSGRGVWYALH
jgi:predicted HTH transcriptional regulator